MYGLTLQTPPAAEPVDLEEMKLHLREDLDDQDELVEAFIKAAREHAEGFLGRALVTQTWDLALSHFPACGEFLIPRPPLQSVTSVSYVDEAGVTQVLAGSEYVVDTAREPGRIVLGYEKSWPITRSVPNAVTVRFVAGYGDPEDVPESIRTAIKLLVGHWYENREATVLTGATTQKVPFGVESLLWMERNFAF